VAVNQVTSAQVTSEQVESQLRHPELVSGSQSAIIIL